MPRPTGPHESFFPRQAPWGRGKELGPEPSWPRAATAERRAVARTGRAALHTAAGEVQVCRWGGVAAQCCWVPMEMTLCLPHPSPELRAGEGALDFHCTVSREDSRHHAGPHGHFPEVKPVASEPLLFFLGPPGAHRLGQLSFPVQPPRKTLSSAEGRRALPPGPWSPLAA